jgi:hypothetical protein
MLKLQIRIYEWHTDLWILHKLGMTSLSFVDERPWAPRSKLPCFQNTEVFCNLMWKQPSQCLGRIRLGYWPLGDWDRIPPKACIFFFVLCVVLSCVCWNLAAGRTESCKMSKTKQGSVTSRRGGQGSARTVEPQESKVKCWLTRQNVALCSDKGLLAAVNGVWTSGVSWRLLNREQIEVQYSDVINTATV